jgi:cellulose 1,4-beta-cellobiosidase
MNWDHWSQSGFYGSCCAEMDVFEGNKAAAAFTAHPCSSSGQSRCQEPDCGHVDGVTGECDGNGCDYNPYRMGNRLYYGPGLTINTSAKFTVITQFITGDGTDTGTLSEIRRIYMQNNVVISNSAVNMPSIPTTDRSITDDFCTDKENAFGD